MVELNPCLNGGCGTNTVQNTIPGASDDPCNSSGLGYFCAGSIWMYDPTLAGADTAANGDCPRAWIRSGGNCLVSEWLEISVASVVVGNAAPVDGQDCCPPGTIFRVASNFSDCDCVWISTNNNGDCTWCQLHQVEFVQANVYISGENFVGPIPQVLTEFGNRAELNITNPSECNCMAVTRSYGATQIDFRNLGANNAVIVYEVQSSIDNGVTWETFTQRSGSLTTIPGQIMETSIGNDNAEFLQVPGQTNLAQYRFMLSNPDGLWDGIITINAQTLTFTGIIGGC